MWEEINARVLVLALKSVGTTDGEVHANPHSSMIHILHFEHETFSLKRVLHDHQVDWFLSLWSSFCLHLLFPTRFHLKKAFAVLSSTFARSCRSKRRMHLRLMRNYLLWDESWERIFPNFVLNKNTFMLSQNRIFISPAWVGGIVDYSKQLMKPNCGLMYALL